MEEKQQFAQSAEDSSPINRVDDEISLLDLVVILLKKKRLIIGITAIAFTGVLSYTIGSIVLPPEKSYMPNVYKPKAVVLISESGAGLSSMLGNTAGLAALAGVNIGGGKSNGELAVFIAKSNTTLDELNTEFEFSKRYKIEKNIKAETRAVVLKNLTVVYEMKTGTLSIAFESIDPIFAMKVVNHLVEILDRRFASLGGNKALLQKHLLETKLAGVQVQIKKLEADVKTFTTKYGVVNVDALATEQITVLARLRSELIIKELEIENYEKYSKIDDPVIRRLKNEKDSIVSKLIQLEKGSGGLIPSQRQLPGIAFEYAALQRDVVVQGEIFKLLTQQYEMAKLNADGQEPAFQILELAEAPDKKSGPSRGTLCIVVTMAGFFFSVLVAFVLNGIENILKDSEAMKKLRGAV